MPRRVVCLRDRVVTTAADVNIDFPIYEDWDVVAVEVKYDSGHARVVSVWVEPDTEAPVAGSITAIGIESGYLNSSCNLTWNGRIPLKGNSLLRASVSAAEAGYAFTFSAVLEKR